MPDPFLGLWLTRQLAPANMARHIASAEGLGVWEFTPPHVCASSVRSPRRRQALAPFSHVPQ